MGKLIIKSERKIQIQKKPSVGISEEIYNKLKNLSEETGYSMTELTNRMIEYAFNNLEVI
jgi:predicted DNA-binding protein